MSWRGADASGQHGQPRSDPGWEFQMMHAGTGIMHSEKNDSDQTTHLYQIWIFPDQKGRTPGYDQRPALNGDSANKLNLIVSPDGREGTMQIYQDASLYLGKLDAGKALEFPIQSGRHVWVQVTKGTLALNGHDLAAGDGVAVSEESVIQFVGGNGRSGCCLTSLRPFVF